MKNDELLYIEDMAFSLGPQATHSNPLPLPDTLPFRLVVDQTTGLISQERHARVEECLDHAYRAGSLLGPAMDESDLGRSYATDFVRFIGGALGVLDGRALLEIGSGRGYLLKLLGEAGASAVGIEPGLANCEYARRFNVNVVRGVFPENAPTGHFDAILAYAVLEHIADPLRFLEQIRVALPKGGKVILSVPDCEHHIELGDSSMLFHEHFSYFDRKSLATLLVKAGFKGVHVETAGFGGALYAVGTAAEIADEIEVDRYDVAALTALFKGSQDRIREKLAKASAEGRSVGAYCPLRIVPYLTRQSTIRFFDDDPELLGRFYPPFCAPIESRHQLLEAPVDELWIMSRTFGPRLKSQLSQEQSLRRTRIRLVAELFGSE